MPNGEDYEAGYEAGYQQAKEDMAQNMGCQLWGIMGRFLQYQPLEDTEVDAVKRRLFGFMNIMTKYKYQLRDIQRIKGTEGLRATLNELNPFDLAKIFF